MTAALMMVALVSGTAFAAKGGNSVNAKLCQGQGYLTQIGSSGQTFASSSDCTSYAAGGGILYTTTPTITAANAPGTFNGGNVYFLHIDGPGWVPNVYTTVTITETWFATPTTYTITKADVPASYWPQFNTGSAGVLANDGTIYENCVDPTGVRRTDSIPYTVTVTDALGQTSNTATGSFECGALQPTLALSFQSGTFGGSNVIWYVLTGNGYGSSAPLQTTAVEWGQSFGPYGNLGSSSVAGTFSNSNQFYDNCVNTSNELVKTPVPVTVTVTDGTYSATASGFVPCDHFTP